MRIFVIGLIPGQYFIGHGGLPGHHLSEFLLREFQGEEPYANSFFASYLSLPFLDSYGFLPSVELQLFESSGVAKISELALEQALFGVFDHFPFEMGNVHYCHNLSSCVFYYICRFWHICSSYDVD